MVEVSAENFWYSGCSLDSPIHVCYAGGVMLADILIGSGGVPPHLHALPGPKGFMLLTFSPKESTLHHPLNPEPRKKL